MAAQKPEGITRRHWMGATMLVGAATLTRPHPIMADELNLPRHVLYYGSDEPPAAFIELQAGPLTMQLDPKLAFLRYIRYGPHVVLLGVYSAVRDRNWGTVEPRVRNLKTTQAGPSFEATFEVDCIDDPIDFHWAGRITGSAEGVIRFEMDGEARSTFLRNRVGFCVLHPIEGVAGKPCTIEKPDGSKEESRLPDLIAPHQPFFDVRAMTHEVAPGVSAEVRMEGDVFETEDQRNWTDASYKTYCTPLSRPFPAEVKQETRIRQSVELRLHGGAKAPAVAARGPEIVIAVDGSKKSLPPVGLGLAASAPRPNESELKRLRALAPAHLRADLHLDTSDWKDHLQRAVSVESRSLNVPIEAAVFVGENVEGQLRELAAAAQELKPRVLHWLVFQEKQNSTPDSVLSAARRILSGNVGGGTNANFTELNRGRPAEPGDVVCYSANPQVHAFDNLSLIETFEGLRHTVRTARSFTGSAKIAVTPVTLKPRFNPVATAAATADPNQLPPQVDVRQMSFFGAGWTLGSLQALIESGVDSLTYYETIGWQGVMETADGCRLPEKFRSIPGAVFPLYHVFTDLAGCREFSPASVSEPLKVSALALWTARGPRLLLANLTADIQYIRVERSGLGANTGLWRIDERSGIEAMRDPDAFRSRPGRTIRYRDTVDLVLPPYAYARVETV